MKLTMEERFKEEQGQSDCNFFVSIRALSTKDDRHVEYRRPLTQLASYKDHKGDILKSIPIDIVAATGKDLDWDS